MKRLESTETTELSTQLASKVFIHENVSYATIMGLMPHHTRNDENSASAKLPPADIGLHTMWNEHFGISVVEMMAGGLSEYPCICTYKLGDAKRTQVETPRSSTRDGSFRDRRG